jgi:NADH-quinone oxidoreductase subunit J
MSAEETPMTFYAAIFYLLAIIILVATGLAITRRQPVHAVLYLIIAFLGTALLFYLLGAPLLAAFEAIIYAGAIMVLFVFIIMMLRVEPSDNPWMTAPLKWSYGIVLGAVSCVLAAVLIISGFTTPIPLETAVAKPQEFGRFLFQRYWLSVEIASLLLLVALAGALYLGRREDKPGRNSFKETS